jgi:hypothetical protein
VRHPLKLSVETDDCQDEFLEMKNDSGAREMFDETSITEFRPLMCDSYPRVAERTIHALLPFVSTYLFESSFSTLLKMKTKQRSRLWVGNDLRCALSSSPLRIQQLAKKKQSQISH